MSKREQLPDQIEPSEKNLQELIQEIEKDFAHRELHDLIDQKSYSMEDSRLIQLEAEKHKPQTAIDGIGELLEKDGVLTDAARASVLDFVDWLEHPRRADDEDIKGNPEKTV